MKKKLFDLFLLLGFLEGFAALVVYLAIPSEAQSSLLFGQSLPRLLLATLVLLIAGFMAGVWLRRRKHPTFGQSLVESIDERIRSGKDFLFTVSSLSLTAFVFAVETFFFTFIILPPFARPLTLWGAALFLQIWILLRVAYPKRYEPVSRIVKRKWQAWEPHQRKTFWVMAAITLAYFCAFIPANGAGWGGSLKAVMSGIDEENQYPVVVSTLSRGDTFSSSVYRFFANESEIYGHQYVTLEALILLPVRLVLGSEFGSQISLNLLLLRQFICVLFSALSIFVMVYMITRFKNLWLSTGLFIFMLTIPGIVRFNTRFLHPDAVVLFLIVLTIYFLQKDDFQFRRYFFFAAVASSLALGIKLWGGFFAFSIALYLVMGLAQKKLTVNRTILLGLGFILLMAVTILVTNPGLMIPAVFKTWTHGLLGSISNRTVGYDDPANSGIYAKDYATWMKAFEENYLQEYYFIICYAALGVYAFLGKRKWLAQILLAWCLPLTLFLIKFIAAKSYWYIMELLIPLYPAPFLLIELTTEKETSVVKRWMGNRWVRAVIWCGVMGVCLSQFIINIIRLSS